MVQVRVDIAVAWSAMVDSYAQLLSQSSGFLLGSRRATDVPTARDAQLVVHQVYGLFKPSTPMCDLFERSHAKWQAFATSQGIPYRLWGAAEILDLIRTAYPEHVERYLAFRHDIMRADFARICILHAQGGLYSDLDVFPNRASYQPLDLGVCVLPRRHGGDLYEIEVILAKKNHPILADYMHHVHEEVARRENVQVYHVRKARYVYNTTGPCSFSRFLKRLKVDFTPLTINWPKDLEGLSLRQREGYDFLSHPSCSYMEGLRRKREPGAPAEGQSPQLQRLRIRMRTQRKRAAEGQQEVQSREVRRRKSCRGYPTTTHGSPRPLSYDYLWEPKALILRLRMRAQGPLSYDYL